MVLKICGNETVLQVAKIKSVFLTVTSTSTYVTSIYVSKSMELIFLI